MSSFSSGKMPWNDAMALSLTFGVVALCRHLFIRGQDLLVVPNCHADQTFAVTIDMEDHQYTSIQKCPAITKLAQAN